jgi:hypothetical protein
MHYKIIFTMRLFAYFVTLAMLAAGLAAIPTPNSHASASFSQTLGNAYNYYRINSGLTPATSLECVNQLANDIDWTTYLASSNEIITDQADITAKGRTKCPELATASFFLAIVQSQAVGLDVLGRIDVWRAGVILVLET